MRAKGLVGLVLRYGLVLGSTQVMARDYSKIPEISYNESSESIENFKDVFYKVSSPKKEKKVYELWEYDRVIAKEFISFSEKVGNELKDLQYRSRKKIDGKIIESKMVSARDAKILYVREGEEDYWDMKVLMTNVELKITDGDGTRIERKDKYSPIIKILR